jgi:predicted ATPase
MSLHASAVRQIPQLLARVASRLDRQTLVSTHSEDLLADTGIDPSEVLILSPSEQGTIVSVGSDDAGLMALARADAPLGGFLVAKTKPADISQLAMVIGDDDE